MSVEQEQVHLFVEAGPDRGRRIEIPPEGARLGRSDSNDVVLTDESLSRFHCRVFFKPDGALWITDLGSTNETLVNNKPIQENRLFEGDKIEIGETLLQVRRAHLHGEVAGGPPPPSSEANPAAAGPGTPHVDLGFEKKPPAKSSAGLHKLLILAGALAVLVVGLLLLTRFGGSPPPAPPQETEAARTLAFTYEKVEAGVKNIFRYFLQLEGNLLLAQIDNVEDGRHLERETEIPPEVASQLAEQIERSGFFDLQESYRGMAANVWDSWDLSVTIDRKTHRVVVQNRVEPEEVRRVRELIEEYAQNELGLAALALPPERLTQMAYEAVLQGQKLFDSREVHYENLSLAIRAFQEAQLYLESIEPKPDYYATAVTGLEECRRTLDRRYDDELFMAERGIKLRDWRTAAKHLRVIIELIPDRSDERHKKASKKLMDVERRLER